MHLFSRKKHQDTPETPVTTEQLQELLVEQMNRQQVYSDAVQALLVMLKEFSFDLTEIGADRFKERVDALNVHFKSEDSARRIKADFDGSKDDILGFIESEKKYFAERESELKNIIQLLREGMTQLLGQNRSFNQHLYESNLRIEQVIYLDDIRKIKESLRSEVTKIKQNIHEKQQMDALQMNKLAQEVDVLRLDLEKVREESLTDGLTGLSNRMSFDSYINKMLDRTAISWRSFALIMCDIDDFKKINDTYGHQTGDRMLRAFAKECKASFRPEDFIGRYGGEEFVIVLPKATLKQALKRAKSFCASIAGKRYLLDENNDAPQTNESDVIHEIFDIFLGHQHKPANTLGFTISVGVSVLSKNDTIDTMIERADQALYLAKHSGKNQVRHEGEIRV